MVSLNLGDLDLGDARRRAAPAAAKLCMSETALDELLNPVRHHAAGRGDRRARQMLDAYNHFREGTVNQIVASAGIPPEHLAQFERDLVQRAEQVNQSFRLLACHSLAELSDPTDPAPSEMVRSGARMGPGVNQHFGGETACGVAKYTVEEINRKANHFWDSVLHRISDAERVDRYGDNRWDEDEDGDEDEDDEFPDLY